MTDDLKNNLQDTFGDQTADRVIQDYAANPDSSTKLIDALRAKLRTSPTARRLMQMADEQRVMIKFLKGREESIYVPESKWIFVCLTPHSAPSARLALLYAGALREVEQNLLGFGRPGNDVDDDTWTTQHAIKNVDIIKNLCIIVDEIVKKDQLDTEFLDSLGQLGHNDIYKALMNQSSDEDLLRLYAKQQQLTTKKG